jgi:hypothetical protein
MRELAAKLRSRMLPGSPDRKRGFAHSLVRVIEDVRRRLRSFHVARKGRHLWMMGIGAIAHIRQRQIDECRELVLFQNRLRYDHSLQSNRAGVGSCCPGPNQQDSCCSRIRRAAAINVLSSRVRAGIYPSQIDRGRDHMMPSSPSCTLATRIRSRHRSIVSSIEAPYSVGGTASPAACLTAPGIA